jgi:hypothetical protein
LLPVGVYALTFELPGFEKTTLEGQDVHLGFTTSVSVILKIATLKQEVTVTAPNPLIDITKTDTSYRLRGDELTRIPTQARTIAELVGYTPGVTGVRINTITGGSINTVLGGARGAETGLPSFRGEGDAGNNWLVDGLSTTGAVNYDPSVRINYDAWDEVQIISDGFAPELGQAMGGFINIVTKSGGNAFHGELGGLVRDHNLRAQRKKQLSAASLPETSPGQYFGNLGGPFIKDKLWFFLSDNFFDNLDSTEQQSISWLTIPGGTRRIQTNNAFGKITFSPHINHTLALSGTWDKFLHQTGGIGVPETYLREDYSDYSYRLNYRGILSQNLIVTATWGQNKRFSRSEPLSGDYGAPCYSWQDIAQTTNNILGDFTDSQWRNDLTVGIADYLDLGPWGNHEIKAGLSYYYFRDKYESRTTGRDFDMWPGNGFDNGTWILWAAPGIPLQINENGPSPSLDWTKGYGGYIEDNFVIGRFSFMLGLRSETQKAFNDVGTVIWNWGLADFLQPRASLAVDLTGEGRNVLKFGYGKFSGPQSISILTFFNSQWGGTFRNYNWVGGENPGEAQLKDPANWEFSHEQSPASGGEDMDPHLKPNFSNKFLLEFDRQIGPNWALKVRGIYSYANNLTEDIGLYDPDLALNNPETHGLKYLYTNFELKKRDYKALEIELNGRVTGRFMLNASYTWSQAKGTMSGNSWEASTWGGVSYGGNRDMNFFGDQPNVPADSPDKAYLDSLYAGLGSRGIGDEGWYGFLPYSVDHQVKILGIYFAPYGFVVSSGIEFLSGYHWEKKGWVLGIGSYLAFPEGRGVRTTPAHAYVDMAVEKEIRLKAGLALGLGINVYNLLNSQRPVSYVKEDTELFGQVWARQLPRWVQLKAAIKF